MSKESSALWQEAQAVGAVGALNLPPLLPDWLAEQA
jgi:hypothetical protein